MWIPENVLLLFLLYFLRSCFFPLFFSICLVLQEEGWAVKLSCSKFHWSVFVITYVDERLHKEKIFNTGQIKECSAEVLFLLPWFFFSPTSCVVSRLRVNCVGVMDILTLPTMDQASIQNYIQHWQVGAVDLEGTSVESHWFWLLICFVSLWGCCCCFNTVF